MAEHIQAIQELQKYPRHVHIFCPRGTEEEAGEGQNESQKLIEEAKARTDKFFAALPLLAYDGAECQQFHKWIYDALDEQLKRCERCIRSYYVGKVAFKTQLFQDYEAEEVHAFLDIIDRRDIGRICAGLDAASKKLEATPPEKRGMKAISVEELFAFFEVLHCDVFLKNEALLRNHFDQPFKLIQVKKELKINEILPATTKFLFSTDPFRLNWAFTTWQRLTKPPTDQQWDWAIKDVVSQELNAIKNEAGLIRFWSALRIVIDKLSEEQVGLKLFDMGFNFARLTLDHLAKSTMAVPHIAQSLSTIWGKAPEAYWQNLPSVSAATVAEQIFASPNFNKCLRQQVSAENKDGTYNVLSWIEPFLEGLQVASRPPAMRTCVNELIKRARSADFPDEVRQLCFWWAVKSMKNTVHAFSEDEAVRNSTARPVLSDLLATVASHMSIVLSFQLTGTEEHQRATRDEVMFLVRNSVALEGLLLKADFEALTLGKPRVQNSSYTPDLWRSIKEHLHQDQVDLSTNLLRATMPLCGLEKFPVRAETQCKSEKQSFNKVFTKVEEMVVGCIERLTEFPSSHLDALFSVQETNMGLMALLFSGNDDLYQVTVELMKNLSEQSGRREALSHVLSSFLDTTLFSICWVFRRVANMMSFAPISRLLQTGKDVMGILCDPTGLFRNLKPDQRQGQAVQSYWTYSWLILGTIFRRMEKWSIDVHDKPLMTEVCRNTMQYAKELFGHYYLFVKLLEEGNSNQKGVNVPKALLNTDVKSSNGSPPKALDAMVKWLRLRDPYLAETLVDLIIDMLRRLKEYGTLIPDDSYCLTFVEEVAIGGKVKGKGTRTILNDNQKAALIRSLENYTGRQIARAVTKVKKQQKLDMATWTDSSNLHSGSVTPRSEVITIDDDYGEDIKEEDLKELEGNELRAAEIERRKALLADKKEQQALLKKQAKPTAAVSSLRDIQAKQAATARAFIEKRKQEEAARKARDRELAARIRGNQTANAGSGLAGLGVEGKDHTMARSDLMVSSESESDSSDGEDELFGASKPTTAITTGLRTGKNVPIPTRVKKQARSAKDMRARLSPDLTGLHKIILGWDFFTDTETPPNSARDDYTLVSNTFKTVEDYQKTFEPLLVLEGWQSFRTAREDGNFKPFELKVANSLIVDNFFELNTVVPMAEGKELGLGPSDVVLLSRGSRPHAEPSEPHCLARIKEITRKRGEMQIVYRVNSANNPMRQYLNDKATVWAVRILSLTPLEREYGSLMALQYYDLAEEIIKAKPSPLLNYADNEVKDIEEIYNVNIAQAKAVKSAVDNDAFTLIQGPPGSGKTKTICAILGAILGQTNAIRGGSLRLNGQVAASSMGKKILVAAPSNAAVDELVMRFKDGVKRLNGSSEKINVVRLGRSEAINAAVKDVTLEELVNARMSENLNVSGAGAKEDIHSIMMEHQKASREMVELKEKMTDIRMKGGQVSNEDDQLHEALRRNKTLLSTKIDNLREKQNSATRDADINRRRIQQEILDSAHVLCATLSGSGHELFQSLNVEFETVIIDEAAQSIELSALIPLKYGCSKCILVGDPKQLPPTVLSRQAAKYQYEQSLFARMEGNYKKDVHLLDIQYRMHPEISAFPSKTFYDSRLRDGGDMARLRARPWHRSTVFAPYRFFDVQGMSESAPKGRSLVNKAEIEVAIRMYDRLTTDVPNYDFRGKVGIITPYKGQLKALKQHFSARYGEGILDVVDFNTTDAFQGRESEIIIFSCVRASTQGIGFLNDVRRMNVGLTRAKCSLWVLGNSQALVQGEFWRALVSDSKDRSLYTNGDILKLLHRPLLTADMMKDDVEMGGMDERSQSPVNESVKPSPTGPRMSSRDESMERSKPTNGIARQNLTSAPSSGRCTPQSRLDPPSRQSSVSSASRSENKKPVDAATNGTSECRTISSSLPKGHDGPSGGRMGFNPMANCRICGSDAHFSHRCDNMEARKAQLGECNRCGMVGHTAGTCQAERCLACGAMGHVEGSCTAESDQCLTEVQRASVRREEEDFQRYKEKYRTKRAEKQLGEHGASIPTVKSSLPASSHAAPDDGKRKRDSSEENRPAKTARTANRPAVPTGPAAMQIRPLSGPARPTGQLLVRKKKVDENAMFAKKR